MNNTPRWESHFTIHKYFPGNISTFTESHGYQYDAEQFMYHQRIILKASDHYIELHRAKNSSHLGYVIVTKNSLGTAHSSETHTLLLTLTYHQH